MTDNRRRESVSLIVERHLVSVIVTILLGLMIWVGNSLTKNIETTARTDERLSNIETNIATLKKDVTLHMRNGYTAADAARRALSVNNRFKRLEKRQDKIETQVGRIEKEQIKNGVYK